MLLLKLLYIPSFVILIVPYPGRTDKIILYLTFVRHENLHYTLKLGLVPEISFFKIK